MAGRYGIVIANVPEGAPPICMSRGGASTLYLPLGWRSKVEVPSLFGVLLRKLAIHARRVSDRRQPVPRAQRASGGLS